MDNEDDSKYSVNYGLNRGYDNEVEDHEVREDEEMNGNDNQFDDDDDDDGVNPQRYPKKRKLKSLLSSYEFAPRVPPSTSARKPLFGGRNTHTDWTEHASFVLLEAWGDRFLRCGRKSLKFEEWQEVADKVSQVSNLKRTDSQCRNRLDTLKKKYKKEKANLEKGGGVNSKWMYFKEMDMLLSSNYRVDSVENALGNPIVNRNSVNGVDEMRGSSGNSDSQENDDDDDDLLPPDKPLKAEMDNGGSLKFLADSINRFSEIYEKVENRKIQQMIELEKMRMDFHKDLELQKRRILDRTRAEITKLRQGDYEDNDVSAENANPVYSTHLLAYGRYIRNSVNGSDEIRKQQDNFLEEYYANLDEITPSKEDVEIITACCEQMIGDNLLIEKDGYSEGMEIPKTVNTYADFLEIMKLANGNQITKQKRGLFIICFERAIVWFHNWNEDDTEKYFPPTLIGSTIGLFDFYKMVTNMGGYERVTIERNWDEVAMDFGFPRNYYKSFKKLYEKYLMLPVAHYEFAMKEPGWSEDLQGVSKETNEPRDQSGDMECAEEDHESSKIATMECEGGTKHGTTSEETDPSIEEYCNDDSEESWNSIGNKEEGTAQKEKAAVVTGIVKISTVLNKVATGTSSNMQDKNEDSEEQDKDEEPEDKTKTDGDYIIID